MNSTEREITLLELESGKCPFEKWYQGIKDKKVRRSILVKITRLQILNSLVLSQLEMEFLNLEFF